MSIIFWQTFARKSSFKIVCSPSFFLLSNTSSHYSSQFKREIFLVFLCTLGPLFLHSQSPTYIPLLLRWHYSTHQTCNFNRGWQGDLDGRCSYGNRWHWQTREAAVHSLDATCAWSDWAHQLSRLPRSLHSQSDGLAQKVCCVHDNRPGAREDAV